jgi:hypothetical protein
MNKIIISSVQMKIFCQNILSTSQSDDTYFLLCGDKGRSVLFEEGTNIKTHCELQNYFRITISTKKINELDDILSLLKEQPLTIAFDNDNLSIEKVLI